MALKRGKSGSRGQRLALQRRLLEAGGTLDDVAAELQRRWGFRPRVAYRHAHGWSQEEAAARFRAMAGQMRIEPTPPPAARMMTPVMTGTRFGEYERWPLGGRRPSLYVLAVLSRVYGTVVGQLLDAADHRAMPAPERAVLALLGDRETSQRRW
jgi:transcriptional regulator with XRE-family HTH domain